MKNRLLLAVAASALCSASFGQVIFSEDFDNIAGPTAGLAGTYTFPAGWYLRNVDNRTPATNVAYVNDAWERREDFANNVADSCAFSTSWYSPAGAADDWMWTPLIGPVSSTTQLRWNAVTYDAAYPDGYEVRVMTAAQGPPTGGTGVMGNQVTNSTVIFSTGAENTTWTLRTADLSAYAGQSVYIGFRNNTNDRFVLLIDDVVVENLVNYDAGIANASVAEYTMIPVSQATPIGTSGTVSNLGTSAITGVTMTLNVYDGTMGQVYTETSSAVASIPAAGSSTINVTGFTPTLPDLYTVELIASMNETDANLANNSTTYTVFITDSTYARDNGNVTGTLGIGAQNGGQLGQAFTLPNADDITSVSFFIGNGSGNMVGQPLSGGVWATDVSGTPTTLLVSTVTVTVNNSMDSLWTLPIVGGSYNLPAGEYAVVVNEVDSNVTIGTVSAIFTTGKTWVNWPTNPLGAWANNEDFSFNVSYVIRPNFSNECVVTSSTTTVNACDTYTWAENSQTYTATGMYSVTLTNAGGCDSLVYLDLTIETLDPGTSLSGNTITANQSGATYQWIDCATGDPIAGETNQSYTATAIGNYAVIVTSTTCGSDTSACVLAGSGGIDENTLLNGVEIYPNPSNGEFTIAVAGLLNEALEITVTDLNGKVVARETRAAQNGDVNVDFRLTAVEPGVYMVTIAAGERQKTERIVISRK